MKARETLLKIIRVRKHLIRTGKSYKNVVLCMRYIGKLEAWLNAYPYATEANVRAYARRHMEKFKYLAPSSANPAHLALNEELQKLNSHATI